MINFNRLTRTGDSPRVMRISRISAEGVMSDRVAEICEICVRKKKTRMSKKETLKWILQLVSAVLTALGATSCMGY